MAEITRNFIAGRMNKSVDERLLPNGEYIDALNVRLGSTEDSEVGSVENAKGNTRLTNLSINGTPLSEQAKCIGAFEDGQRETIYWFIHDSSFNGGIADLVVSFNVTQTLLTYHVVTTSSPLVPDEISVLNFNSRYLITGVNRVEDLLFWTDNYNQPRVINIKRNYDSVAPDLAEQLLVIKKPPTQAPTFELVNVSGEENFLEERFITFAYRYRYEDGEYSALSQFCEPAFVPKSFEYTIDSGLNEGMVNAFNSANVTFNSGGRLVKSVEVVFKETTSNVIKSIELFNKQNLGYADNTNYILSFNNSKIYTVLNATQLVRMFDNVPLKAQAQTVMGNRLIYGNYVDGYDLEDLNLNPIKLEYFTELISEEIGIGEFPDFSIAYIYSIDVQRSTPNAAAFFDLADVELKAGTTLFFEIRYGHQGFSGDTPAPTQTSSNLELDFSFNLPVDFNSVYELSIDPSFVNLLGTAANIKPVYDSVPGNETSCDGSTVTDNFNCTIPNNLDALSKFASGISGEGQPITIISSPSSTEIGIVPIAMRFVDDLANPTFNVYEYYQVSSSSGTFISTGNPKSLHSDRDYEIGIVYMDEFNRSSTALVSPQNTVHVGCSKSATQNSVQVTIPQEQLAPSWADRYKFVMKPDFEDYNTVYSNLFIADTTTSAVFFLLEGENARKVQEGDRLRVKADTSGVTSRCQYATVLTKTAETRNFIVPAPTSESGQEIPIPAGTYMKIIPNDFTVVEAELPFILEGAKSNCGQRKGEHPRLSYPVSIPDVDNPGLYLQYDIPQGSRVNINVTFNRNGTNGKCEKRAYILELKLVASQDYDNFKEFFDGDNIASRLDGGRVEVAGSQDCPPPYFANYYNPVLRVPADGQMPADRCVYQWQFIEGNESGTPGDPTNSLSLGLVGTNSCAGAANSQKRRACIDATIEVFRAETTLVFETEPQDATPDLWYESADVYSIDKDTGTHEGNIQNQTATQSAIIKTDFFNCFSFGNGVESYRIRDSVVGKEFSLGERTTSTSEVEFRQAHRFSDLTYSGVYNDESNVNKLNEFNLGLLNFKPLEDVYGPIEKLSGRETDILVLQEDKISYVLAGKNLISDSVGGGTVASIPEVLGTQIARIEEYGISRNPESFCSWGFDKYFTDAKRGAVIKLTGSSGSNEQLTVVSESGMRSWFRDRFISSINYQKIGGFDPYMNEYVLSMNPTELPSEEECIACGINREFTFNNDKSVEYCLDLGTVVGDTALTVTAQTPSGSELSSIRVRYNSVDVVPTTVLSNGTTGWIFDKNSVSQNTATVFIEGKKNSSLTVRLACPAPSTIRVYQICLTNKPDAGNNIHNEYRWTDGTFVSPLHSEQVTFLDDTGTFVISQYTNIVAPQGAGVVPANGAQVSIISNKRPTDSFVFDPAQDSFYSLSTSTNYPPTPAGIASLLNDAGAPLPLNVSQAPTVYSGEFIMPVTGGNLYLVYDYRQSTPASLCYSTSSLQNACCDCQEP